MSHRADFELFLAAHGENHREFFPLDLVTEARTLLKGRLDAREDHRDKPQKLTVHRGVLSRVLANPVVR